MFGFCLLGLYFVWKQLEQYHNSKEWLTNLDSSDIYFVCDGWEKFDLKIKGTFGAPQTILCRRRTDIYHLSWNIN